MINDSFQGDLLFPKKQVIFSDYFGRKVIFSLNVSLNPDIFLLFFCLLFEISPLFQQLFEYTMQPNNLVSVTKYLPSRNLVSNRRCKNNSMCCISYTTVR